MQAVTSMFRSPIKTQKISRLSCSEMGNGSRLFVQHMVVWKSRALSINTLKLQFGIERP